MPRRPPEDKPDIPLYLVPHIVAEGFRQHGGEVERITIKKTRRHFYDVRSRPRPIRRELKGGGRPGDRP